MSTAVDGKVNNVMIHDDLQWHRENAEKMYRAQRHQSDALTSQQELEVNMKACNHMALFLQWAIDNDLMSENVDAVLVKKVADGDMKSHTYLVKHLNGQLTDEMFAAGMDAFMSYYYGDLFFDDYTDVCVNEKRPLYSFISDEAQYSSLAGRISEAFSEFFSDINEEE